MFCYIYRNVSQHHDDIIIKDEILNLTYCFVIFCVMKIWGQKYSKRHFDWLRSRNMKIYQPMEGNKPTRPLPQGVFSTTVGVFKVWSLHYRTPTPPLDCSGDSGVACVSFCLASLWWWGGGRGAMVLKVSDKSPALRFSRFNYAELLSRRSPQMLQRLCSS